MTQQMILIVINLVVKILHGLYFLTITRETKHKSILTL